MRRTKREQTLANYGKRGLAQGRKLDSMRGTVKKGVIKRIGPNGRSKPLSLSDQAWGEITRSLELTKREAQIIRGIFNDRTEPAIAADLGISVHTVHTHVERLHRKLGVVDGVSLVLLMMDEFLKLTTAPASGLPPICARREAGLCHFHD
jgi:DNA-binding CsgD family transcriptional regulator